MSSADIQARIVYYGPSGSGTSANLEFIHRKLRREHRGEFKSLQSPGKPAAKFEMLPVELGKVHGRTTSLIIHTVPGGPAHADKRRELVRDADGIVFVADLRPERHDATIDALGELRSSLESAGRGFGDLVFVVQYNRRDCADENALDRLHRRMGVEPAAFFEAVAHQGSGVLQTLTGMSKLILNRLRTASDRPSPPAAEPAPAQAAPRKGLRIESAGPVDFEDGGLRIPIRLLDEDSGRKTELSLRLTVDDLS
jgi:hypothetical protein